MWLVKYNENGRDQKQYFEEKENLEHFTQGLKERGIKFKVSKNKDWKPDEGKSNIDNPDRIVNDKQKSVEKFVENKQEKIEKQLHEFQIELTPSTKSLSKVNYNGKEVPIGDLPKNVYDAVNFIIRKLRPEEKKKFYADDTGTWDIVSKADGTLVVKDDEGNDYTKILKQRIGKAKL